MPVDPVILIPDQPDPTSDDRECRACGYALRGLPRGTDCPECGCSESLAEPATLPGGLSKPSKTSQQCGGCGYLLKGLPSVGICPECGVPYNPGSSRPRPIDLITPQTLVSTRFRSGLAILITAIASALLMQVVVLFYKIQPDDYRLLMTMISIAWATGLSLVLVRRVASKNTFMTLTWFVTLLSQWAWPLAYGWARYGSMNPTTFGQFSSILILICDIIASVGLFSSLCFLAMICRDLYLRRQASRLEMVAFIFPLYAIGIWIFAYPAEVTNGHLLVDQAFGNGFRLSLYLIVLGPWWALFIMVGLALKDIYVQSIWESRNENMQSNRLQSGSRHDDSKSEHADPPVSGPSEEMPEVNREYWNKSGDIPLSPPDSQASE